jgi:hypothetical protein
MKLAPYTLTLWLLAGCVLGGSVAAAPSLPDGSIPMTPDELVDLYAGKTQVWKEGRGGYFFARDHRMSAYASKKTGSYAVGKWQVTDSGEVCISVRWVWGKGPRGRGPFQKTCWAHRKFDGQIWKQDQGAWYQWNRSGGESSNFIKGYKFYDQVTALHDRYGR